MFGAAHGPFRIHQIWIWGFPGFYFMSRDPEEAPQKPSNRWSHISQWAHQPKINARSLQGRSSSMESWEDSQKVGRRTSGFFGPDTLGPNYALRKKAHPNLFNWHSQAQESRRAINLSSLAHRKSRATQTQTPTPSPQACHAQKRRSRPFERSWNALRRSKPVLGRKFSRFQV